MFSAYWDAFLLTTVVKSSHMRYCIFLTARTNLAIFLWPLLSTELLLIQCFLFFNTILCKFFREGCVWNSQAFRSFWNTQTSRSVSSIYAIIKVKEITLILHFEVCFWCEIDLNLYSYELYCLQVYNLQKSCQRAQLWNSGYKYTCHGQVRNHENDELSQTKSEHFLTVLYSTHISLFVL